MRVTYLANREGYCPTDAPMLRSRIEALIDRRPVIVRVATREIHLYTPWQLTPEEEELLSQSISPPSRLKAPPCQGPPTVRVLCRYGRLYTLERYWEAHEVGEELWSLGFPAGQLLAVAAGVLARAQEGDTKAVDTILDRVLPVVAGSQAGVGVPLDPGRLRVMAHQVLSCSPAGAHLFTLSLQLLSYRRK